jgi:hypothetical protein
MHFNYPDKLRYEIKDPLVILGNGPSLAKVNFNTVKYFDSCGFNTAYREFARKAFWPKYYATFDHVQAQVHREAFDALASKRIPNGIEGFFVPWLIDELSQYDNVHLMPYYCGNIPRYPKDPELKPSFDNIHWVGPTGTMMVEVGMCMGYTKFVLLGIDSHVAPLEEQGMKPVEGNMSGLYVMEDPSKHTVHWFDDYLRKGDIAWFGAPNIESEQYAAVQGWELLKDYADNHGIQIINGSPDSAVRAFKKMTWQESLSFWD